MPTPVLKVLAPGCSAMLQDQGRPGWKRFGVPPGGAIDGHSAVVANRLLNNTPWAPVVELALHGAKFEVLRASWIAITGADAGALLPRWRTIRVSVGDVLHFPHTLDGVWTYLAVEDGFASPLWLDSASRWPAAGFGTGLVEGDILEKADGPGLHLARGIGARCATPDDVREFRALPTLRVYRAAQWDAFSEAAREKFFSQPWTVTPQCSRVGWRLRGEAIEAPKSQLISEPTPLGSVQIPPDGQPIVLMNDGPVVGGYHKPVLVAPEDLPWLAQTVPGAQVRFTLVQD